MERLPDDVLSHIFESLESTGWTLTFVVPHVCRRWKQLCLERVRVRHLDLVGIPMTTAGSMLRVVPPTLPDTKLVFERLFKFYSVGIHNCEHLISGSIDVSLAQHWVHLQELNLGGCIKLTTLAGIEVCSKISKLTLKDCTALCDASNLASLQSLKYIYLSGCSSLENFDFFSGFHNIEKIFLQKCSALASLPDMRNCSQLQDIRCISCKHLANIRELGSCNRLQHADFTGCKALENFAPLSLCPLLCWLIAGNCGGGGPQWSFEAHSKLIDLCLLGCATLGNIQFLTFDGSNCEASLTLTSISIAYCICLRDLTPLGKCPNLKCLDMAHCCSVVDVSFLSNCRKLLALRMEGCIEVKDFRPVAHCFELRLASLAGTLINDLSVLGHLPSLRKLDITCCEHLSNMALLVQFTGLTWLGASWSPSREVVHVLRYLSTQRRVIVEIS